PGVKEALSAREHSIAIQQNKPEPEPAQRGEAAAATTSDVQSQAQTPAAAQPVEPQAEHHDDTQKNTRHSLEEESNWPYGQAERKPSKEAWWRTLGRGRKRDTESE
ncbi:N-acetyltransferase, partial [Bifidobacterium longum]|nr:N-acetyltransferase [Bifidobacterium longum]